jgi:hypothetical protein
LLSPPRTKSDVTLPAPPTRTTDTPGDCRIRSATIGVCRRSIVSWSKTDTLAASWPAGTSLRVALTTTASCTGAMVSVSRMSSWLCARGQDARAATNPVNDASIEHPSGTSPCVRNRPSASVKVVVTTAPADDFTVTNARTTG